MREVNRLIIHCSATKPDMDIGVATIREWHTMPPPKGNGWKDIGYHYVIRRNGTVEKGRPVEEVGAHVAGHNKDSIGICLAGGIDAHGKPEANFTGEQWAALKSLIEALKMRYKDASIHGHNEFDKGKACPSFDVQMWLRENMV